MPTSSIKFYIREGLLPPGERSHRNQARYGEEHLDRLDLIRALREVADLPLEVVREVLAQTERPRPDADPIGAALEVIYQPPSRERSGEEERAFAKLRSEVETLLADLDWMEWTQVPERHRRLNLETIVDAVLQLRRHVDPDFPLAKLRDFANAAWLLSEAAHRGYEDLVPSPDDDLIESTRAGIVGTLLVEPLVLAMFRAANTMRTLHIAEGDEPPGPRLRDLVTGTPD